MFDIDCRTFVTFILVNFFNIIPLNFSNYIWLVQISMLLVDTSSLLLLGLASLKVVSSLSINNGNQDIKFKFNNLGEDQSSKYEKNLEVLNKFHFSGCISSSLLLYYKLLLS